MTPRIGDTVKIKPQRAAAYGIPAGTRYVVKAISERPGYKVPWIVLNSGAVVRPSELTTAW